MRSARLCGAFLLLAAAVAVLGALVGGVTAFACGWVALSFGMVGIAYAGVPQLVFRKSAITGRVAWHRKALLAPYLAMTWLSWHAVRLSSREPPCVELVPGLYVGRRLRRAEYPENIVTIVDLTHEIEEHLPNRERTRYVNLPILDGAPLSSFDLRKVAQRILTLEQPIYLHCALGHGRTAMVSAAVLIVSGAASSPEEALSLLARVRPAARPNRAQRAALAQLTK